MATVVPARQHRRTFRGPARVLPPEDVARALRRVRDGEAHDSVAKAYGISRRTLWRYRAEPQSAIERRFVDALDRWPRAAVLSEADRIHLARWLGEEFDGWTR